MLLLGLVTFEVDFCEICVYICLSIFFFNVEMDSFEYSEIVNLFSLFFFAMKEFDE